MSDWAKYNYKAEKLKYGYKEKELVAGQEMAAMSLMGSSAAMSHETEVLEIGLQSQESSQSHEQRQAAGWQIFGMNITSQVGKLVTVAVIMTAIGAVIVGIVRSVSSRRKSK